MGDFLPDEEKHMPFQIEFWAKYKTLSQGENMAKSDKSATTTNTSKDRGKIIKIQVRC